MRPHHVAVARATVSAVAVLVLVACVHVHAVDVESQRLMSARTRQSGSSASGTDDLDGTWWYRIGLLQRRAF